MERQYTPYDRAVELEGDTAMGYTPEQSAAIYPRSNPQQDSQQAEQAFSDTPDDKTPFDFNETPDQTPGDSPEPNPVSTQVMAMAMAGPNIQSPNDVAGALSQARVEAESAAKNMETKSLNMQIAVKRALASQKNIRLNVPQLTNDVLTATADAYQGQVANTNLQEQVKTAKEKEAIDQIQNLAAAGDSTQARILLDRINPSKPENIDLTHAWHENLTKSLMLAQLAAKYKQEDDEEGWLASAYTGLISLFQPSTFSYLGNVDNGIGGFIQRNPITRFFTPGHDLQNQAQAIWNLSSEQLADYLPQLDANIRSNSRYLGVTNPDKLNELISYFQSPLGDAAATQTSAGANLETALTYAPGVGIVPFKMAAKGLSLPFTMVRAGARREAAAALAEANETLVREGAEAAFTKHGIDEATIIDETQPSIINPEKGGPQLNVSLNNEVNAVSQMAEDTLKEWTPRETERFANAEEFAAARDAKLEEIHARYGMQAMDFEVVRNELADGTHTNVIRATFGNPHGGLFATEREARAWRTSVGFGDGEVKEVIVPETVARQAPQPVTVTEKIRAGVSRNIDRVFKAQREVNTTIEDVTDREIANDVGSNVALTAKENDILNKAWDRGWAKLDDLTKARLLRNPSEMAELREQVVDNMLADKRIVRALKPVESPAVKIAKTEPTPAEPANENTIVKDPSGGFANVLEFDMPETAFYTQLNTPEQGATSRFLKNISQTSDEGVYGKGLIADQKANRMYKQIEKAMRDAYTPLRPKEKIWFEQVVAFQANEKRWLEQHEIEPLLERAMGKAPRPELVNAVLKHRVLNDIEFLMRRDGVYRDKVIRGFESVKFSAFGDTFDIDAKINYSPSLAPRTRAYNISDDIHYVGDKTLTSERVKELSDRGYIVVKTEKPLKLKDGTQIDTFVGRRSDFLTSRLRKDQLGYSPGGHRIYLSKYQVKQAAYIEQPDTGSKSLASPNTFVMAGNIRDARRWAARMNEARIAAKAGKDAAFLDANVFRGEKGFPKGEDFLDQIDKGLIHKDAPFEALYDRDLPSAYKEAGPDLEAILGEGEPSGVNSYFRTTGRMYYSGKGDHMPDTYGELAPTVDPVKAQAMALYNITRLSASFGDYKISAMERWVNKYRPFLNIREGLNPDEARSSVSIFNKAEPREGLDFDLKQQMLGQRESIRRVLGFETDLDRNYRHWMRSTAEWIIGDSDSAVRQKASEGVFWLYENNPVNFLRGLAFDSKLGLFNVGQVFIQGSTMASAMALNPRYGKFGLASAIPNMAYFLSHGNENVLERLAKSGVPKLAGFSDVAEWKTYIREAQKSGFFDLGGTHTMVNNFGPEKFASSIRNGTQHVREMGRYFFYNVEVMNRLVAHRIAYGEAIEKFGSAKWDSNLFQEFIARRSENYSFNMSNASKSWWQTGLMSIPTQFWAYNIRMIEALVGKNFTTAQKVRLLGSQIAMAGTAGVPIVAGLADAVKTHYGVEPKVDTMAGVMNRGLADYMVYEMFGADVNIGERWGTGSWSSDLLRDIFGYSKYNNKSFADIAFGSTYGISKSILAPLLGSSYDVAMKWMTHESGQEEVDLTGDQIMEMFRQISTVNHTLQAMEIYNYGLYKSSKGKVLANDLPKEDAVFAALGFAPGELNELSTMTGYMKNRQDVIKDAANQITAWREEALTRPDMFETNSKKVNAFVKFLPADIRRDVLSRAHGQVKPSIYASVKDRFDKTRVNEQLANQIEENSGKSN